MAASDHLARQVLRERFLLPEFDPLVIVRLAPPAPCTLLMA